MLFPLFSVLLLFFVALTAGASRHHHGQVCTFKGKFLCKNINRHVIEKVDLPPNACIIHKCDNCIRSTESFLLTENFNLVRPTTFILRHLETNNTADSTSYACANENGLRCDCDEEKCDGTPEFCKMRNCLPSTDCKCHLTRQTPQLIAITNSTTLYNPTIFNIEICLFDKKQTYKVKSVHRTLLEKESAALTQNNLTISFEDPILHLPALGRVIVRTPDFEHVLTVPQDLMIKIPFELLAYKTTLQIIYLHHSGKTVAGNIHVSGKSVCALRLCIICPEIFHHLKCFPPLIQSAFYGILIVLFLVCLLCLKLVIKSFIFLLKFFYFFLYGIYKIGKLMARCSLLLGAFLGTIMQELLHNFHQYLEAYAAQGLNVFALPLVLLAFSLVISQSNA